MEIVFGHEVKSIDDNFLQIASKGGKTIAAAGPVGAHLVDLIPICKCYIFVDGFESFSDISNYPVRFIPDWFPGAGFKTQLALWSKTYSDMEDVPLDFVKKQMVSMRI